MSATAPSRYAWLAAVPVLLLTFGLLLLYVIPHLHMRPDENWTYDYMPAANPVALVGILTHDTHPPLWWLAFWSWVQTTGDHEITGRMQAALFGMVTLALAYHLGRHWFRDWRYGLFAMVALASSSLFLIYTSEIRQYGLIYLLVVACMLAFWRWLQRRTWRSALRYGLFAALLLFIHYYLAFLIVAQVLFFIAWVASAKLTQRARLWRQGISAGALALLIWLPWVPVFVQQMLKLNRLTPAEFTRVGLIPAARPTNSETVLALLTEIGNGWAWLPVLILAWGALRHWRRGAYWLLLAWGLLPLLMIFALNTRVDVYTQRYVTFAVIGVALACGVALAGLPRFVRWLALLAFVLNGLWYLPQAVPVRVPFRVLGTEMAQVAQPSDLLLFDMENYDGFVQKQLRRYLPPDLQGNIVLVEDALPTTTGQSRVWHVTDNLFIGSVYERFKALEADDRYLTDVVGQCDAAWCFVFQLLETAPSQQPLDVFGDTLAFHGYTLEARTPDALEVRLWWRSVTPAPTDYAIGVYLLDASYGVVAQHDGMVNDFFEGETPIQNLDPQRPYYLDVRRLPLAPDLAPGSYYLAAAVYDWRENFRLPLANNGGDTLIIDTLVLE